MFYYTKGIHSEKFYGLRMYNDPNLAKLLPLTES